MADTLTPNVLLTNQTEGGNSNTWGQIADANFEQIDDKFGDRTAISTTGGNTTLTDEQEIVAIVDVSGALVSNASIIFSGRGGTWIVRNQSTGNFSVTAKVSGQSGVAIEQGGAAVVYCDGTDVRLGNPPSSSTAEVTVASATTTEVLGAASEFVAISGTGTITSFGTGTNRKRFCRATGAFLITHNASSLICPGGQNIRAASGDTFIIVSDASSNVRILAYQRAANPPPFVPVGLGPVPFAGATAPSFWLFCYGQTLLRTDYPALFAAIGTTYGTTDSSNFLLPDCRGRVIAGKDDMGGTSANRLTNQSGGVDGDTLGAVGGAETNTLTEAQLAAHMHAAGTLAAVSDGAHTHFAFASTGASGVMTSGNQPATTSSGVGGADSSFNAVIGGHANAAAVGLTSSNGAHTHTVSGSTASDGSGAAHNNVQPTLIQNMMIYAGA